MSALESLKLFVPETFLLCGAFVTLLADLFTRNKKAIGLLGLAVAVITLFLFKAPEGSHALFFGFYTLDSFTHFFRVAAVSIVAVTILISIAYTSFSENSEGEYYSLFLMMAFALILMASSLNLLMIFLGIEFVSILSYLLVGFLKKSPIAKEAAIKYLLYGSLASGIMLYGMSLLFGATGSLDLAVIGQTLAVHDSFQVVATVSLILMMVGLGFKISMAPFHMWAPDVYQAAPTPVAGFLTVAPKALGFAIILRVLTIVFADFAWQWTALLSALAILTMTIGNILAISQNSVKRLLAYSSIAQAGYILMGVVAYNALGLQAVLVYLIAYAFTNLGAFTVVLIVQQSVGNDDLDSFTGLSKRSPVLAAGMTIFLLSLAGIPPTAGFIGKFLVFSAAIQADLITLVIAAALNSAVAAYYYFRIVRVMYLIPSKEESSISLALTWKVALLILLIGTLAFGLCPTPLLEFAAIHAVAN